LDTFWHLLNFFLPAAVVGAVSAGMVKLLWRRRPNAVALRVLGRWATGASALALTIGLWVFDRDGRLESYALMVAGCAAGLWWAGFRGGRRA
jgi:hypothetical protein